MQPLNPANSPFSFWYAGFVYSCGLGWIWGNAGGAFLMAALFRLDGGLCGLWGWVVSACPALGGGWGGGSISFPACLGWWGWVCGGVGCVEVSALPALGGVGWWWLLLPCLLPCLPCRHPRHLKRLWRVRTLPFLPPSFVVWVRCDSSGFRLFP